MSTRFVQKFAGTTDTGGFLDLQNAAGIGVDSSESYFLKYNANGTVRTLMSDSITNTLSDTSSKFTQDIYTTFASAIGNNTASLNGAIRGIIAGDALTKTNVAMAGVYGVYWITTSNASNWPSAAIIGEIHDGSTGADGGIISLFVTGNSGTPTAATSLFAGQKLGTGSNPTYGLDFGNTISGSQALTFDNADIRFASGAWFVSLTSAITANSTTTSAPAGSLGTTTHATGRTKIFISDGSKWQYAQVA